MHEILAFFADESFLAFALVVLGMMLAFWSDRDKQDKEK